MAKFVIEAETKIEKEQKQKHGNHQNQTARVTVITSWLVGPETNMPKNGRRRIAKVKILGHIQGIWQLFPIEPSGEKIEG